MYLTFIVEAVCVLCGHRNRGRNFAWGCRVNKHSIAREGGLIALDQRCAECRAPAIPTDRCWLDAESTQRVRARRAKKGWPADV